MSDKNSGGNYRSWRGWDTVLYGALSLAFMIFSGVSACSSFLYFESVYLGDYQGVNLVDSRGVYPSDSSSSEKTDNVKVLVTSKNGFTLTGADGLTFMPPPEKDTETGMYIYKSVSVPSTGFHYSSQSGTSARLVVLSGEILLTPDFSQLARMFLHLVLFAFSFYALTHLGTTQIKE